MEATALRGLINLCVATGNLSRYPSPSGGFSQLTLTGSKNTAAYFDDKVTEVRRFISSGAQVTPYSRLSANRDRYIAQALRYRISSSKLEPVYNLLYPNGFKEITSPVLEMCGARAAAWFWAEGAKINKDGSVHLKRVGLDYTEAELVSEWLRFLLMGVESEVSDQYSRPRLIFTPENARKAAARIKPYAPISRIHLFELGGEE